MHNRTESLPHLLKSLSSCTVDESSLHLEDLAIYGPRLPSPVCKLEVDEESYRGDKWLWRTGCFTCSVKDCKSSLTLESARYSLTSGTLYCLSHAPSDLAELTHVPQLSQ
jgi:hypothetical protein